MKTFTRYNPVAMLVRWLVNHELRAMLEDIHYRARLLKNGERVGSQQLTMKHHILDGFTLTDNHPEAGEVEWTGCHVVYEGTDYTITEDHAASGEIYVWWDKSVSTTTFQHSATKPTLIDEDCLICLNIGGYHKIAIGPGRMQHGAFLVGNSIRSGELASGAAIAAKILDGAVTETKIGSVAVVAAKILDGAVTQTKIGDGAVTAIKINDGAVTEGKIGDLAVTAVKINDGAATVDKLGALAVTVDKIGTGAVTVNKLGNLAVTAAKIQNLTVVGGKVAAGTLDTTKLNLLAHLVY